MTEITKAAMKSQYRMHWHVFFTHFPLSLYGAAFGFQILHLFIYPDCFELATTVTLLGGTAMMIPAVVSGWLTWKKQYNALNVRLFRIKITVSVVMLITGMILCLWRLVHFKRFLLEPTGMLHWLFFAGILALIVGAIVEGYYGGRLSHR